MTLGLLIVRHYRHYFSGVHNFNRYFGTLGVTLSLRGNSIPTDGSGRIVITDINPDGDNDEDALICLSERSFYFNSYGGDWYLHPTQQTMLDSVRIESTDLRGWHRNRAVFADDRRLVRLRRDDSVASGGRALEGVFTCHISNTPVSVGIYYPSESHVQSLIFKTKLCIILLLYFLFSNIIILFPYIICILYYDATYSIHSWTQSHQWMSQSMWCHQDKEHSQ